jgi:hypothetical protein
MILYHASTSLPNICKIVQTRVWGVSSLSGHASRSRVRSRLPSRGAPNSRTEQNRISAPECPQPGADRRRRTGTAVADAELSNSESEIADPQAQREFELDRTMIVFFVNIDRRGRDSVRFTAASRESREHGDGEQRPGCRLRLPPRVPSVQRKRRASCELRALTRSTLAVARRPSRSCRSCQL